MKKCTSDNLCLMEEEIDYMQELMLNTMAVPKMKMKQNTAQEKYDAMLLRLLIDNFCKEIEEKYGK